MHKDCYVSLAPERTREAGSISSFLVDKWWSASAVVLLMISCCSRTAHAGSVMLPESQQQEMEEKLLHTAADFVLQHMHIPEVNVH